MTFSSFLRPEGLFVAFKNFQPFPCFGVFFEVKQFNRHKNWCLLLFNYSSLSYISHASSSAVSKLPNKTSTFHDFQGPTIKSHDFPGLENEMLKFLDFPGFYDLYEPCYQQKQNIPPFSLSARSVHGLLKTLQNSNIL